MLQDLANSMTSKFIPDFATQGLVDHDYTVLAMRRYAESSRYYSTKIIRKVKSQHTALIEPIIHFRQTQLKSYKDSRRNFDNAQTKYDNALSLYLVLPKIRSRLLLGRMLSSWLKHVMNMSKQGLLFAVLF